MLLRVSLGGLFGRSCLHQTGRVKYQTKKNKGIYHLGKVFVLVCTLDLCKVCISVIGSLGGREREHPEVFFINLPGSFYVERSFVL